MGRRASLHHFPSIRHILLRVLEIFQKKMLFKKATGTSLAVSWLKLHASNAEGEDLISDQATKIPYAAMLQKEKKRKEKRKTPRTLVSSILSL